MMMTRRTDCIHIHLGLVCLSVSLCARLEIPGLIYLSLGYVGDTTADVYLP